MGGRPGGGGAPLRAARAAGLVRLARRQPGHDRSVTRRGARSRCTVPAVRGTSVHRLPVDAVLDRPDARDHRSQAGPARRGRDVERPAGSSGLGCGARRHSGRRPGHGRGEAEAAHRAPGTAHGSRGAVGRRRRPAHRDGGCRLDRRRLAPRGPDRPDRGRVRRADQRRPRRTHRPRARFGRRPDRRRCAGGDDPGQGRPRGRGRDRRRLRRPVRRRHPGHRRGLRRRPRRRAQVDRGEHRQAALGIHDVGDVLEQRGGHLDAVGRPDDAVRTLSASAARQRRVGRTWPRTEGTAQRLEQLRARLGAARFTLAWRAGQHLELAELVEPTATDEPTPADQQPGSRAAR